MDFENTLGFRAARLFVRLVAGKDAAERFGSISVRIDDSNNNKGWVSERGRDRFRSAWEHYENYGDAVEAWLKNPIAWRIIFPTSAADL